MRFQRWTAVALVALAPACLATGPDARAAFITSGVYDEAVNQSNAVDVEAASNNITLAAFSTLVANAFAANEGGVIDFDYTQPGTTGLGSGDISTLATQINSVYGVSQSATMRINRGLYNGSSGSAPTMSVSPSVAGGTQSLSGFGASDAEQLHLGSQSGDGNDFRLTFTDSSGTTAQPVIAFGLTFLGRTDAGQSYTVVFEVGLVDLVGGGNPQTATFASETIDIGSGDDTFFGYQAPAGKMIQYVRSNNSRLARMDDMAFVIVPEPASSSAIGLGLAIACSAAFTKRRREIAKQG
ncbi:MAG: PEP-CTERM sorting domain-containing protein [Pirellulales bacterium]|nr:PEP-CTERM sorting domain-containing protein [Pirellulales bacterium]